MTKASSWHDLRLRLASAAVIVPVALLAITWGGIVYDVMVIAISVGMVHEGASMLGHSWKVKRGNWRSAVLLAWPAVALIASLKERWGAGIAVAFLGFIFGAAYWIVLFVSIIGGLALLWLRHLPVFGLSSVLFVILVVIASDSFAYVVGRLVGGPKLAPSISPGKTRSGAVGGLFGAGLAGGCVAAVVAPDTMLGGVIWGIVLGTAGQCGDLIESAAKRRLGVKDSGRLIPGHGGLLDRFDALLAAAPLAALLSMAVVGRPFWSDRPADLVGALMHVPSALASASFG